MYFFKNGGMVQSNYKQFVIKVNEASVNISATHTFGVLL